MLRSIIHPLLVIACAGSISLHASDTLTLTYDQSPVNYRTASTPTAVASVYLDISWIFMKRCDSIAAYIKSQDAERYTALQKRIELISLDSKDPNDIRAYVKNERLKSDYVRLVMGRMSKNYIGVRTPYVIRLAFNPAGYLSFLECKGFAVTDDGFALTDSVMLPMKIHRSVFKQYGI